MTNYTSVKSFTFRKASVKLYNIRVAVAGQVYAFPSHEWNETHPLKITAGPTMTAANLYDWKVSLSDKSVFNYTTSGFPFIWGFPSHEWNETHPLTMTTGIYTSVKSFTFWKVCFQLYQFRVPVYKGVAFPRMKGYTSFNDDCWPGIRLWQVSLPQKWVLNCSTLGFLFIRGGFPPMNEIKPIL